MADIYEHWHQHMVAAAANIPGAGETWEGGIPGSPPNPTSGDPLALLAWVLPILTGLITSAQELAQEVDRLRDEVDELKSRP